MAKTSLGIGFDPAAISPESGFKPIQQFQGSSIPNLAFSVLGGFQLLDLVITELKSHMTCYHSMPLIG